MIVTEKEKHLDIIYGKLGKKIDLDLPMWLLSHGVYESTELPRILKRCKKIMISTLIAGSPRITKNQQAGKKSSEIWHFQSFLA